MAASQQGSSEPSSAKKTPAKRFRWDVQDNLGALRIIQPLEGKYPMMGRGRIRTRAYLSDVFLKGHSQERLSLARTLWLAAGHEHAGSSFVHF